MESFELSCMPVCGIYVCIYIFLLYVHILESKWTILRSRLMDTVILEILFYKT